MKTFQIFSIKRTPRALRTALLLLVIIISPARGICGDRYKIFGKYFLGFTNPNGDLGQSTSTTLNTGLNSGWNMGFDGAYPFDTHVAVGLDIRYSMFPIDASGYDGNYKILSLKPTLFFGSFSPDNGFVAAGFVGGGYSFLITPPHTVASLYGTYNYSSHSDLGLGVGTGFLYGYRLSDSFGIGGAVAYDYLILAPNGNGGGSYLSVDIGLLITVVEGL